MKTKKTAQEKKIIQAKEDLLNVLAKFRGEISIRTRVGTYKTLLDSIDNEIDILEAELKML